MNSLISSQSAERSNDLLFSVFLTVFVEGQATPVHFGTYNDIPLTTENAFRALLQKMWPNVRKAGLAVLRPKGRELLEIPNWVGSGEFYFEKGKVATVRSKGPSPDYPKVVDFNGVRHRLPRPAKRKSKAKKKISRSVSRKAAPGKRKRKATVQKRKPLKATRKPTNSAKRKSNKRK